jgi:uncharacterized Zn-binding protein involved in type VI secretion
MQSHGGIAITASTNVFANGLPVHRVTDLCYCPFPPISPHGIQPLVKGSMTVFANSLPLGRIGDMYACGAVVVTGAQTVFAG